MANIKTEHFKQSIATAANETPSAAELSYNYIGGGVYSTAKNLEAIGTAGQEYLKQFNNSYDDARSKGAEKWDAFKHAASQSYPGFAQATQAWADQRVNEVADKLTSSQQAYYRAAMFEAFDGIAVSSENTGGLGEAKQRMINEEGENDGNNIAKLLRSAAGQNRRDLIDQIGQYNRARGLINY